MVGNRLKLVQAMNLAWTFLQIAHCPVRRQKTRRGALVLFRSIMHLRLSKSTKMPETWDDLGSKKVV
jgi:hypothetical protein